MAFKYPSCKKCKCGLMPGEDRLECPCGNVLVRFKSGRGGERVPGPGKRLGAPPKPARERTVVKGPYRFPPDVVEILGGQRNATHFICEAVRAVGNPEAVEAAIGYCRCGTNHVRINGAGSCPNGCAADKTTVGAAEAIEVVG